MKTNRTVLILSVLCAVLVVGCPPPPGACDPSGTGSIVVTFSGLPVGVEGSATVMGSTSQTLTAGQTVSVSSGNYAVTAQKVVVADPRVRTVYAPRVSAPNFCLTRSASQAVEVTWTKVPTSNRLWVGNANGTGTVNAFDGPGLVSTATVASTWNATSPGSKGLAFDRDGNLWALGGTVSDPLVMRFPADSFGTNVRPSPDRSLNLMGLDCIPAATSLAFSAAGDLFIGSSCKDEVYRLPSSALEASGTVPPASKFTGLSSVNGLAFDADGNLWVADPVAKEVVRFDAASLTQAGPTATRRVKAKATDMPADTSLLAPGALAFDATGNLWTADFGANIIFFFPKAELAGSGSRTTTPSVRVSVQVLALLDGLAFDEGGGLWLPFTAGKLARLAPSQLTVSTGAGAPTMPETILSASSLGSALDPAFFPAPKALPLFHALP